MKYADELPRRSERGNVNPLPLEGGKRFPAGRLIRAKIGGWPFNVRRITMTVRTSDYDEIIGVMQLYIDGFNDNDISKFRKAS